MPETATVRLSNPAVIGFGGFGLTTIIQQLHELSLCNAGPGIACGLIFGGLVQFFAGFQEMKAGNNFHYALFTSCGVFWLVYSLGQLLNRFDGFQTSMVDTGYFMIVWNVYIVIFWVASFFMHGAMLSTFTWLVLGFILLNLAHFGFPAMGKVAAFVFIFSALNGWYIMAHILLKDVSGRDVLPVGDPWMKPKRRDDTH